jgi:hypothetical protein
LAEVKNGHGVGEANLAVALHYIWQKHFLGEAIPHIRTKFYATQVRRTISSFLGRQAHKSTHTRPVDEIARQERGKRPRWASASYKPTDIGHRQCVRRSEPVG